MGTPGDIKLGPSGSETLLSPFGRTFRKRERESALASRTVNGRLIKDIRWRKQDFDLTYSIIDGTTLAVLQGLWDLEAELSLIWTDADGTDNTHTVQMSPFDARRLVLLDDGLWRGTTIRLTEV